MKSESGIRTELERELAAAAAELRTAGAALRNLPEWQALDRLQAAAHDVEQAWSGSSVGYFASVYYIDYATPPMGAHFSQEWGFIQSFAGGTRGSWREYRHEAVLEHIFDVAGDPDLTSLDEFATRTRATIEEARASLESILSLAGTDTYLESLLVKTRAAVLLTVSDAVKAQLPHGDFMSRDMVALSQGVRLAPHQDIYARVAAIRSVTKACEDLANFFDQARNHLSRRAMSGPRPTLGNRVFIGHGRSPAWRELKDFVSDRLGLPWDEFERRPTAGVAHTERLQEMLDGSGMALLVLTAEDERADGVFQARQNVIHEAGLFQARLGWKRAVVLLEEGCDEFSNIHGLGQIRFPAGNIGAAFEKVRRVLEREALLSAVPVTAEGERRAALRADKNPKKKSEST